MFSRIFLFFLMLFVYSTVFATTELPAPTDQYDADMSNINYLSKKTVRDKPSTYHFSSTTDEEKSIAQSHGLGAFNGSVNNQGLIEANIDKTGNTSSVAFTGDKLIGFSTDDAAARNPNISKANQMIKGSGKMAVSGETASRILDNMINMSGIAQANSVVQRNGEIVFSVFAYSR